VNQGFSCLKEFGIVASEAAAPHPVASKRGNMASRGLFLKQPSRLYFMKAKQLAFHPPFLWHKTTYGNDVKMLKSPELTLFLPKSSPWISSKNQHGSGFHAHRCLKALK